MFSSLIFVNLKPIEQFLNSKSVKNMVKCDIDWESMNSLISGFCSFANIFGLKVFGLSIFRFDLFDKWRTVIKSLSNIC